VETVEHADPRLAGTPTPQCEWLINEVRCTGVATTVLPSKCPTCNDVLTSRACEWHVSVWFASPEPWLCEACRTVVLIGEPIRLRAANA
jgi:hypothetical protein